MRCIVRVFPCDWLIALGGRWPGYNSRITRRKLTRTET